MHDKDSAVFELVKRSVNSLALHCLGVLYVKLLSGDSIIPLPDGKWGVIKEFLPPQVVNEEGVVSALDVSIFLSEEKALRYTEEGVAVSDDDFPIAHLEFALSQSGWGGATELVVLEGGRSASN